MALFPLIENSSTTESLLFTAFALFIVAFLVIDLFFLNRQAHKISTKAALYQSIFWVVISSIFGLLIYLYHKNPSEAALEYFSSYLTEYALSMDNIFVIVLIFQYFQVKEQYLHKILFWGVLGAIVFRAIFIVLGTILISKFHWILYGFGGFLIYSSIKIYFGHSDSNHVNPDKNPLLRLCKKYLPMTDDERGGRFIIFKPKLMFTPLFLVVVLIETTDLIFAIDSIPAVFTITQNEFLIYTSNIFAVLGLRSMFFLFAGIIDKFYLLQKGLSLLLFFIGFKMLLEFFDVIVPTAMSFTIILTTLTLSMVLSVLVPQKEIEDAL